MIAAPTNPIAILCRAACEAIRVLAHIENLSRMPTMILRRTGGHHDGLPGSVVVTALPGGVSKTAENSAGL